MALRPQDIQAAQVVQDAAAHSTAAQVRLVAGPGTGKSSTIEERVCWLLREGTDTTANRYSDWSPSVNRYISHWQLNGRRGQSAMTFSKFLAVGRLRPLSQLQTVRAATPSCRAMAT